MPSQNTGNEMPVIDTTRTATSAGRSLRSAATTPAGMPSRALSTTATTASSTVAGSRPSRASSTGWAAVREKPQSPRSRSRT